MLSVTGEERGRGEGEREGGREREKEGGREREREREHTQTVSCLRV